MNSDSFDPNFDPDNSSTLYLERLPPQNILRMYENYGAVHGRFTWEARQQEKILNTYTKIWGTDELLVSFDELDMTLLGLIAPQTYWLAMAGELGED
ncbi:hypothetical protein N7510_011178 [Penicillium lagena]|uniref:uncharacterized protein n=1 Tax=Penicillium lagena TaxID=94218 RepID=UPI00253F8100|nr:uncharacterized protein N7510_011178 [Penicillium lagena]KAJ5601644.1 hypothetical protein N7510_011178 [Penicillium lagena]